MKTATMPTAGSTVTIKRQSYVVVESAVATDDLKMHSNGSVIGSAIVRKPRGAKTFFCWVRTDGSMTDPA